MDYDAAAKVYSESTTASTKHSPILAWVRDGYPLYGPYGYSNATNPASGIRRLVSGFVLRNGQNGTQNLTAVGRVIIPPVIAPTIVNVIPRRSAQPMAGSVNRWRQSAHAFLN